MRQQLMNAFTDIYVLDLHGNTRKRERSPDGSPDENVFDIEQGVAISIFVKDPHKKGPASVHRSDLWGNREDKYSWLLEHSLADTPVVQVTPDTPFYFFTEQTTKFRAEYERGWRVTDAMPVNSSGIVTARDHFVFDFDTEPLLNRIKDLRSAALPDSEVREKYFRGRGAAQYPPGDSRGWKLPQARKRLRADLNWRDRVTPCLYRPFDIRPVYYAPWMVDWPRPDVMGHMLAGQNVALVTSRMTKGESFKHVQATRTVTEVICLSPKTSNNAFIFPLYTYPASARQEPRQTKLFEPEAASGGDSRKANFAKGFVDELTDAVGLAYVPDGAGDLSESIGPEDVFHYIYAILHAPSFRERYAEFLKVDFPRIPLTGDVELFRTLARFGRELLSVLFLESPVVHRLVTSYPVKGDNRVDPGHPRYLSAGGIDPATGQATTSGRVYISADNPKQGKRGQFIAGVPQEVWDFEIGGYQVCEKWLKDRRGRTLTTTEITHFEQVVVALSEIARLMKEIDASIPAWPLP